MQEIRYLAKFKSEYIVNYNHSWVQVNLEEEFNDSVDSSIELIEEEPILSSQNVSVGFNWDSYNSDDNEKFKCNSNHEDDDSKLAKKYDIKSKRKSYCKVRIGNKDYLYTLLYLYFIA